jgi:NADH:ubiquinone oxidoreductase subunit 2 (subunit N)
MVSTQMVPFEIRDARLDAHYVKNSVNIYGLKTIKIVGYVLLLSILVFQITNIQINNSFELHFSSLIILIIMTVLIWKSTDNQPKYFSSLVVESIPVYWLIMDLVL